MNRKIVFLSLLATFPFSACESSENPAAPKENTFTVIWQNYNGDVLEIDHNVKENSDPSYDGITPVKNKTSHYSYVFAGWDKQLKKVTENITYTATYVSNINKYTVTWKNYDGSILEEDKDVLFGTLPSYNGETPVREAEADVTFTFIGWDKDLLEIIDDITFTAKYKQIGRRDPIEGETPIISQDGKIVKYGLYPQTKVTDTSLIASLDALTEKTINGWYEFENTYYVKETAATYNGESYNFNDSTSITNGASYWFKCEPIEWNVLNKSGNNYMLLSSNLLTNKCFYNNFEQRTISGKTIYANNYKESCIREYLNGEFINTAFVLNDTFLLTTNIDNSSLTSDSETNSYECENTLDKVYLLSYKDYLNADFGFSNDSTIESNSRIAKTTDYARATGTWSNTKDSGYINNGTFFTRTPCSLYDYCAWNVNSGGFLSSYAVDGVGSGIRPAITISIN